VGIIIECFYIIQTADEIGHYKVGKTMNFKNRLNTYNGDKKDDIIPIYIYESDDINNIEKCVKTYAKKFQYRKYKEVYKTDINLLKELINDCIEFNEKIKLKNEMENPYNLWKLLYYTL